MFFVSFLSYPNWVIPFLRATVNNLRADFGFNVRAIFLHIWPSQGGVLAWVLIAALVIVLGYEWSFARSGDFRRFYWTSCLSLAVAPLLGFRTEMEHLAVLIIPLALIFSIVYDRWYRIGSGLTVLLMLAIFTLPFPGWLYRRVPVAFTGTLATTSAAFKSHPFGTVELDIATLATLDVGVPVTHRARTQPSRFILAW